MFATFLNVSNLSDMCLILNCLPNWFFGEILILWEYTPKKSLPWENPTSNFRSFPSYTFSLNLRNKKKSLVTNKRENHLFTPLNQQTFLLVSVNAVFWYRNNDTFLVKKTKRCYEFPSLIVVVGPDVRRRSGKRGMDGGGGRAAGVIVGKLFHVKMKNDPDSKLENWLVYLDSVPFEIRKEEAKKKKKKEGGRKKTFHTYIALHNFAIAQKIILHEIPSSKSGRRGGIKTRDETKKKRSYTFLTDKASLLVLAITMLHPFTSFYSVAKCLQVLLSQFFFFGGFFFMSHPIND